MSRRIVGKVRGLVNGVNEWATGDVPWWEFILRSEVLGNIPLTLLPCYASLLLSCCLQPLSFRPGEEISPQEIM